jgi:hypothetical protein
MIANLFEQSVVVVTNPFYTFPFPIPWPEEDIGLCIFASFVIIEWVECEFEMEMIEILLIWYS